MSQPVEMVVVHVSYAGGVRPLPTLPLGQGRHEVPASVYDAFRETPAWRSWCAAGHVGVRDPRRKAAPEPEKPADQDSTQEGTGGDQPQGDAVAGPAESSEPAPPEPEAAPEPEKPAKGKSKQK